jgi:hypothetical protein
MFFATGGQLCNDQRLVATSRMGLGRFWLITQQPVGGAAGGVADSGLPGDGGRGEIRENVALCVPAEQLGGSVDRGFSEHSYEVGAQGDAGREDEYLGGPREYATLYGDPAGSGLR